MRIIQFRCRRYHSIIYVKCEYNYWSKATPLTEGAEGTDDVDDAGSYSSSDTSWSTNDTSDDNPGPGRLLDKYLYQKGGKKVERLIFWTRMRIPNIDPSRISNYIEFLTRPHGPDGSMVTKREAIIDLQHFFGKDNASTIISGLKNLVHQTK